jgi:hypothetical protein
VYEPAPASVVETVQESQPVPAQEEKKEESGGSILQRLKRLTGEE